MTPPRLAFEEVFTRDAIRKVVEVYDERWSRGSLRARGATGMARYEWWTSNSVDERVEEVFAAAQKLAGEPQPGWPALLQVPVSKDVALPGYLEQVVAPFVGRARSRTTKNRGPRLICAASPVAQALQYVMFDAVAPYIDEKLSKRAIAYRTGLPMVTAFKKAIQFAWEEKLYSVAVVDVVGFYDSILWYPLDQAIDTLPFDPALRRALKTLARVDVVDAEGRPVARIKGIPQGLVVGPHLANLFMAHHFDSRVQTIIGKWGVYLFRYGDDIALFARDRGRLAKALAVVRTELGQLRLAVKDGTGRVHDLKNPDNLPSWLGFTISHNDVWADQRKLQGKVRKLLLLGERGELDDDDLGHRLDAAYAYLTRVLHPTRAAEAVAYMQHVLDNHFPSPRKETLENIQRQLRGPKQMETGTSQPVGAGGDTFVPVEEVHLPGREVGIRFPVEGHPSLSRLRAGFDGPPNATCGPSLPHNGYGVRADALPRDEGSSAAGLGAPGHVRPGDGFLAGTSLRPSTGGGASAGPDLRLAPSSSFSLAWPSGPPNSLEPAGSQRVRSYKKTRLLQAKAAIESTWRVTVVGRGGPARVQWCGAARVAPPKPARDIGIEEVDGRSAPEVHLAGYQAALRLLRESENKKAGWIVIAVTDVTLDGYLRREWRIGKPSIRSRWAELRSLVFDMESDGAAVWFELLDGRMVYAGRETAPGRGRNAAR